MPPPVRRFVRVLTCLTVLALTAVATRQPPATAGSRRSSPASPDAKSIRDIYWLILAITGGIFVLVTGTLLIFIVRYRSKGRPRELEGPQVRGHTKLELAWTAGPVVLLAIIAGFVFWKVSDIGANSSVAGSQEITVEGHQYYWNFTYPNGATSVDTLRLPVDRTVRLTVLLGGRQPQLVDPRARRKARRDPGPDESPDPPRDQARDLRRAVRRVLRPAARGHAGPRPGAAGRPVRLLGECPRERPARARQGDLRRRLRQVPRSRRAGRLRAEHRAEPAARRQERAHEAPPPRHGQDAGRRQRLVAGAARRDDRVPPSSASSREQAVAARAERPTRLAGRLAGPRLELADDGRPQADRDSLHRQMSRLLPGGRRARAADARPARDAERAHRDPQQLQRALHDARDDDGLPRRRADLGRPRQLPGAADDRGARHGVPAPERALVLALPARRDHPLLELVRGRRRAAGGLDRLRAALGGALHPGARDGPLDPLAARADALVARGRDQLPGHDRPACARPG